VVTWLIAGLLASVEGGWLDANPVSTSGP